MRLLGPDELTRRWYLIVEGIERALVHGDGGVTPVGLLRQCLSGHAQCWIREDEYGTILGSGITRYEQSEKDSFLAIIAFSDEDFFSHKGDSHQIIEGFARESGCTKMCIYGRRGWKRALSDLGYYEPYTTMIKDLK